MKKAIRKVVIVIMAAAISLSFTACMRNLNIDNAKQLENLLKEKYGVEFVVKSIGNRLADGKLDTVSAYCYPKDNKKAVFEAVMGVGNELISDDYPVRLLEIEAKDMIEDTYAKNGVKATVNVSISRLSGSVDFLNTTVKQLIADYPKLSLTFTTVMCDGAEAEAAYDTTVELLNGFYSGDPEMLLGTTIWKYGEDAYEACAAELNGIPDIGKTALERHGPLTTVNVAMSKGAINISFADFVKKF